MQNTESPLMNNGEAKNDAKVVVNTAVVESEPAKSDADKQDQFIVINPEIAAQRILTRLATSVKYRYKERLQTRGTVL